MEHVPPITIIVEGQAGTGKTFLTPFILDALALAGFTLDSVQDNAPIRPGGPPKPHNKIVAHRIVEF